MSKELENLIKRIAIKDVQLAVVEAKFNGYRIDADWLENKLKELEEQLK